MAQEPKIVDSHFHVWPGNATCATNRGYLPPCGKSIEEGFEVQSRHGVTHGVLIQPSFIGVDNSYLLASLPAHAARLLAGFGSDRVVWASDFPWTKHEQGRSYGDALDVLKLCVPDEECRRANLGANVARLSSLSADGAVTPSVAE